MGDFRTWQNLTDAADARLALGDLRQAARATSARVPVDIRLRRTRGRRDRRSSRRATGGGGCRKPSSWSSTRITTSSPTSSWTLEPIHDEAVVLHSSLAGYDTTSTNRRSSSAFATRDDLTERVVSVIKSKLHRIRYVWTYSGNTPIVLRDSALALPPGSPVRVQRITWVDPERNRFVGGDEFHSSIKHATFHRYDLTEEDFKRTAAGERPDPLSNAAYRVVLLRPADRAWLFRTLTAVLVALFVLAGVTAAFSLRRARAVLSSSPAL